MANKIKIEDCFVDFLKNEKMKLEWRRSLYSSQGTVSVKVVEKSEDAGGTSMQVEDFLKAKLCYVEEKVVKKFVYWLLSRKMNDFALKVLIDKTSNKNIKDYDDSYKKNVFSLMEIAKINKELLFSYVNRVKFLDGEGTGFLREAFKVIDEQEKRKEIFMTVFKTKSFSTIDKQNEVYQIMNDFLKNKEELSGFFNLLENNMGDYGDALNKGEFCALVFCCDLKKVINIKLVEALSLKESNNNGVGYYDGLLNYWVANIEEEKLNKLGVVDISTKMKGDIRFYTVLCNEESKDIVKCFFENLILHVFEKVDHNNNKKDDIEFLYKKSISQVLGGKLDIVERDCKRMKV